MNPDAVLLIDCSLIWKKLAQPIIQPVDLHPYFMELGALIGEIQERADLDRVSIPTAASFQEAMNTAFSQLTHIEYMLSEEQYHAVGTA